MMLDVEVIGPANLRNNEYVLVQDAQGRIYRIYRMLVEKQPSYPNVRVDEMDLEEVT